MNYPGISLIEFLLVIALVALLAAVSAPLSANMLIASQHTTAVDRVLGSLKKAQRYSMAQEEGASWGVCFVAPATVRLYEGSCNGTGRREEFVLPNSVSLTGLTDVSFSTVRGVPSAATQFTLDSGKSTTIDITAAGGIGVVQ